LWICDLEGGPSAQTGSQRRLRTQGRFDVWSFTTSNGRRRTEDVGALLGGGNPGAKIRSSRRDRSSVRPCASAVMDPVGDGLRLSPRSDRMPAPSSIHLAVENLPPLVEGSPGRASLRQAFPTDSRNHGQLKCPWSHGNCARTWLSRILDGLEDRLSSFGVLASISTRTCFAPQASARPAQRHPGQPWPQAFADGLACGSS